MGTSKESTHYEATLLEGWRTDSVGKVLPLKV